MVKIINKYIKNVLLISVTMLMLGCSTNQSVDLKSIALMFDESKLTAEIQANNKFKAQIDNNTISVEFSGSIKKIKQDYLLNVLVVKASKFAKTTNQVNSTLLIKRENLGKPIVIAGIYQHSESIDEQNNVKITGAASTMSIKINR